MKQVPFREPDRKSFHEDDYGMTYEEYVEMERREHDQKVGTAQELVLNYYNQFSAVTGDREAVSRIRKTLREDETFWDVSWAVIKLVEGEVNWISAIFRSEAKSLERSIGEKREQIRLEREAARRAEREAERAEMEASPMFGMF
ncbi:hypothetical protein HGG70_05105 [Rhodobacteraceae bacterium R_SAG4]|nr:hypothetical protein [Rhodobacteraceae bacterium R_SAG4]